MIITKSEIKKFRGFADVELSLGNQITVIAGQNGTQKTTILGMLTQPFTISDQANPMKKEKPLSGGSFKSGFSEKFKLSPAFDKAKEHEWTLFLNNHQPSPFTVESIKRSGQTIRFWQKGVRTAGSGYIQVPVIYLSLQRLLPIGEDSKLKTNTSLNLSQDDISFLNRWHNKILISLDNTTQYEYLTSPSKTTLGITTNHYDWHQNSAGQDNIGKILLAILSFKKLKEKHKDQYQGGLLAIDELDATLYPASQLELLKALRTFSSKYDIQIVFTTHSLTILEHACSIQEFNKSLPKAIDDIKVIFLEKVNSNIKILQDISFNAITHKLNLTIEQKATKFIDVFTEDKEAIIFCKALLKNKAKLRFINCSFSCGDLVELVKNKVPTFLFPQSIIILDGDVRQPLGNKIKKLDNVLILPTTNSIERILADYLYTLSDESPLWKSVDTNFTKQYCFKNYSIEEIQQDRVKAKEWFNSHLKVWGRSATKVINPWMQANLAIVNEFQDSFQKIYNKFATTLGLDLI